MFWKIHLEIVDFHKQFSEQNLLLEYNKKIKPVNNFFGFGGIFLIVVCILYPIIDSIFFAKKKVLCFGFLIPYVDPEEIVGYLCTFVFQNIQVSVLALGYATCLRMFWIFFAHAIARIDLLIITVSDLTKHTTDNDDHEKHTVMTKKLDEIIELHNEYLRFIYFQILVSG